MPDNNPLDRIEFLHGSSDLGASAYAIYKGALDEGAEPTEASMIVTAWFIALFTSSATDGDNADSD